MEKAGLKTFVYSFVFSLFAVFCANSLYLRTLPSPRKDIKIPNKNVTLFLKDLTTDPQKIQAVPAKKIALSILPEIKKEIPADNQKIPLDIDRIIEDDKSFEAAEIPLEIVSKPETATAVNPASAKFRKETAKTSSPPQPAEKIVSNFDEVIKKAPPIDETELTPAVQKIAALPDNPPLPVLHKEQPPAPIAAPIPAAGKTEKTQLETAEAADTAPFSEENEKEAPQLLIPLQKDNGIIRVAGREIEIVNSAENNRVALNSGNIPIKSMIEKTKSSGDASKKQKKQWQPMADKVPETAKEPLWLAAKGAKNPKNNLVLESESYQQDEKEIKRILSGKNADEPKINGQPVELAAETVKNLLIPIPEEILKNDNLTPQLASSPKNKMIEERLNADIADGHYDDDYADMNDTAVKDAGSGKGGLLDSLSSIFSSKDKKVPEIGSSVEGSSETGNSLFSAFSGKKTRKKSNARILPTEMRLSFQPNRAEISGQTLKWIRAFANKINEEKNTGLEIRIDGTSAPALQQRRLNLLQNILTGEKVNYNKINTVFTSREPNSFIIRTVKINTRTEDIPKNYKQPANNRYQQW